ncbi:MAG TPA: hypothetical protein VMT66_16905 [Steroidobacteraceae bacterium]|nr:hypothetical protein [Steroidobacteraceae bacterium]
MTKAKVDPKAGMPVPATAGTMKWPTNPHPLWGMFFLTFRENGRLHLQGQIVGVDGDTVLGLLFDWIAGERTNVQAFTKQFIYSDKVRLYLDEDIWLAEGREFTRRGMEAAR